MDQNAVKLYDSLFTIEEMLTEVVAECATASELANKSNLSEIATRLRAGLLDPLQEFLDENGPTSMATIVEIADGIPAPRLTERKQASPIQERVEESEETAYSQSGDPKYDNMFNSLLKSSKEIEETGRVKFKLDEVNSPSEADLEKPISVNLDEMKNPPPQMPGARSTGVEFDGMENWRNVLSESTPEPSRPQGGDAGDMASAIMGMSESDVVGPSPSSGNPSQANPSADLDADVSSILSSL